MFKRTAAAKIPKTIKVLTQKDIRFQYVPVGYQGVFHTVFIRANKPWNEAPLCGLFSAKKKDIDERYSYALITEFTLDEIEALIPLLETTRRKMLELAKQFGRS